MSKNFYITTTLPYTNSDPHIGFAAEIIKADVIARVERLLGNVVVFNTGTDEHGLKIYQKAQEAGMEPRAYCDSYAEKFHSLREALNVSFTNFIRTSDDHHVMAAQEFWRLCEKNGDIYKKNYQVKYCVGCEMEKTESELVNNRCPLHPAKDLEVIDEENYFFRFSKYQEALLKLYEERPDFVVPSNRLTEIKNFVAGGLQDFSVSRLASKMPNGVPVPGDESQVMYVWFDALANYISTLGWPEDQKQFQDFWPAVQVCGKDNLRQQSAMWQAMLASAGLPFSKQVLVFGFLSLNGQKISKSTGNTVDPFITAEKFGIDAVRYYLLTEIQMFEDGDFSEERLVQKYNADLANGLGNLVARVSNLLEKNNISTKLDRHQAEMAAKDFFVDYSKDAYRFGVNLQAIWQLIAANNEKLSASAPWKMSDKKEIENILRPIAESILHIACLLAPFLPDSAEKIIKQFSAEQVTKGESLFPRLS
ncbi:MAG: methionine--tRNA ligase [Candidatus Falkowbacteria bacterium]|nr:methionine--tRNA ligase [Candidatus Falkowbacteria bacterium]